MANSGTHADLAYGNEYEKRGKNWYVKLSFRAAASPTGKWFKADQYMGMTIERMIRAGKIVEQGK